MIEVKKGCLIEGFAKHEVNAIAHVCNCQGKMNSGVAKAIRETHPTAYTAYLIHHERYRGETLGMVSEATLDVVLNWEGGTPTPRKIFNMNAQKNYGYDGRRYINYEAFYACAESVGLRMQNKGITTLGIPFLMGSDRAGGNWRIIQTILEETIATRGVDITAFKF